MAQSVYITYTEELKLVADAISEDLFLNEQILVDSTSLTSNDILKIAKKSTTEFFYVINSDKEIKFPKFDFSYKPPEWDRKYVHIWDKELRIRLYSKSNVLKNPDLYSDSNISAGLVELKIMYENIFSFATADIIFLSFDEPTANERFEALKHRFPAAKRVHGVKGILPAHIAAAKKANSNFFYVVDADAEIVDDFDFSYYPDGYNFETVHVWNSTNPVNGLVYGYGGVKLFPRKQVINYNGLPVDFTTSVSKNFRVMNSISNVTKFNVDSFSTWRSAFRECVKLSSNIIDNSVSSENVERLEIWCNTASGAEFSKYALQGANAGRAFGIAHKNQPEMIGLINDYDWLYKQFQSQQ